MALRAGRKGVNRKSVDYKGNIKGGGGSSDIIQELQAKVSFLLNELLSIVNIATERVRCGILHSSVNHNVIMSFDSDSGGYKIATSNEPLGTSFIFDCSDYVGKILHIDVTAGYGETLSYSLVGCTDELIEGRDVDYVPMPYRFDFSTLSVNVPITSKYVVVYVSSSTEVTNVEIDCTGLIFY